MRTPKYNIHDTIKIVGDYATDCRGEVLSIVGISYDHKRDTIEYELLDADNFASDRWREDDMKLAKPVS